MRFHASPGLRAGPFPLKRILVLGDLSDATQNAAWRAGLLAQEHGAWLRILHLPAWNEPAGRAQPQLEALAWQLQEHLRIAVIAQSLRGGPARELAAAEADLLVVPGSAGWLAGWRMERLLRRSGLPVLVVRKPAAVAYRRVVAGIHDASHASVCIAAASGMAGGPHRELLREAGAGIEARITELAAAAPGCRMKEAPRVVRTSSAAVLLDWERTLFPDLLVVSHAPPWRRVLARTRTDMLVLADAGAGLEGAQGGEPQADPGVHGAMVWPS